MKAVGRVITYGTFDLFHIGHLSMLERLRALGDELYVGVSTDQFNESKKKKSVFKYTERAQIIAALRCVTMVFPEENWEQKTDDVIRYNVTTFGIGDDWKNRFDFLAPICKVVYLPRTDGISTTAIILGLQGELGRGLR